MKRLEDPAASMDAGALIRRAHDLGLRLEHYDPNKLAGEIAELLTNHGLSPKCSGHGGATVGAAGMLLRSFGIVPAVDVRTIDRLNAPDADDR